MSEHTFGVPDIVDLKEVSEDNTTPASTTAYSRPPSPPKGQPGYPAVYSPPKPRPASPAKYAHPLGVSSANLPAQDYTKTDPAIVSVGKPQSSLNLAAQANGAHQVLPQAINGFAGSVSGPSIKERRASTKYEKQAVALEEPLEKLDLNGNGHIKASFKGKEPVHDEQDADVLETLGRGIGTRNERRRRRRDKRKETPTPEQATKSQGQSTKSKATPTQDTTRGKGWRQTPLLEPTPKFQPFDTLKKARKGRNSAKNGWDTEDATDVQGMGDFDFESNLLAFNKEKLFKQIQEDDQTADEDRLVSVNRLPKPGTAGGKNLHHTENVLDMPKTKTRKDKFNSSDESEYEEERREVVSMESGSGRNSRRADSRMRKAPVDLRASVGSTSLRADSIPSPTNGFAGAFYLDNGNNHVECVSALQMLNVENIVSTELGLTEEMMNENAGRGIAEVALAALTQNPYALTPPRKGPGAERVPLTVVFAGNNKSGARGIAAARQMRNHGANAIVVVLGLEREAELLEGVRTQLKVFKSFGGKVLSKTEFFEHLKHITAPFQLVIDGLLGPTVSFEELRLSDQAGAYELIEWANRCKCDVVAIDLPTGLDPATGKASIVDGKKLYLNANYVVSMGAPKKGLLGAMQGGEGVEGGICPKGPWELALADIGLSKAAWRKGGTRMRRGVDFEENWVMAMYFGQMT